ncbi:hypothetical protein AB0J86_25585 [Micromonospora sp. NPDC049559]|uniref:hypothetical protein n=1 Tax=Micromonospora sp. NPDC049559 TaxID=3155923 RepID=UPI00343F065A
MPADLAITADPATAADLAARARAALDRFPPAPAGGRVDPADRIEWAAARFDGGDPAGAAEELTRALDGWLPEDFATAAPRILHGERALEVATAALGGEHPYRTYVSGRNGPEHAVAGTLARLVAGTPDAEETLLRTVLAVRPNEEGIPRPAAHLRVARISAALAVLAEAHADEPEHLDRWSALLDDDDRPRLAAAAALLGPLGLAETERRCGTVAEVDGERLVAAFARAGRFDDALTLATRLGPDAQQRALLALATPGLPATRARALVAAFRSCPKRGRERDHQMIYQHRFARLFLALERVDDALAVLGRMRDCRYSGYGPGPLAREVARWLDGRREQATPQRLRAVLAVLADPRVIPQELAAVVADVVPLVHALADEPLRAEIVDRHVPELRARLRRTSWPLLADVGLGAALVATGDVTALDPLFARAVDGPTGGRPSLALSRLAVRAGLPARDRPLFTRLLAADLAEGRPRVEVVLPVLDAEALAVVPDAVAAARGDRHGWLVAAVARFADRIGEPALLAAMLDAAPDPESARTAAGRAAMALARRGSLAEALEIAARCGLAEGEPR